MFKPTKKKDKIPSWMKKKVGPKKIGIDEPIRQTMYDLVVENLKTANRKTFLHRLIYIGTHTFGKTEELATQFFSKTVDANNLDSIESITGLYLHYPKLFVHVVEGDEDSINKHLKLLLGSKHAAFLGEMKVLADLCNINDRLAKDWSTYASSPRQLVNPPTHSETDTSEDTARQIFNCVGKIYELIIRMNSSSSNIKEIRETEKIESNLMLETSSMLRHSKSTLRASSLYGSFSSFFGPQICLYRDYLPEFELLEYIITSPYTIDLKYYSEIWGTTKQVQLDKDRVWPIDTDFVRYDIYEEVYDRVIDMPKEGTRKRRKLKEGDTDEEDLDVEEEEEEFEESN